MREPDLQAVKALEAFVFDGGEVDLHARLSALTGALMTGEGPLAADARRGPNWGSIRTCCVVPPTERSADLALRLDRG